MTILVTGSSGFIGTNLLNYLLIKRKKFVGIDKKQSKYFKGKNIFKFDLNNFKKLEKIFMSRKIKYVVHLAAIPGFVSCHNDPLSAFKNNVDVTNNLLFLSQKYRVKRIIIASSMGVDNFYTKPGFYSLTKIISEKLALTYNYNFKNFIQIAKISNVFGCYSTHKSSVIHSFIKKIIKGKKLEIHNTGKQNRDFIFVQDVCKSLFSSLFSNKSNMNIFIRTNSYNSILEIKKILNKISKKNNKAKFYKTPKGYDDVIYKRKKAKNRDYLYKNLKKTYNWYLENYS